MKVNRGRTSELTREDDEVHRVEKGESYDDSVVRHRERAQGERIGCGSRVGEFLGVVGELGGEERLEKMNRRGGRPGGWDPRAGGGGCWERALGLRGRGWAARALCRESASGMGRGRLPGEGAAGSWGSEVGRRDGLGRKKSWPFSFMLLFFSLSNSFLHFLFKFGFSLEFQIYHAL